MKYFYTDPLAAAWMAKHFDMKFDIPDDVNGKVKAGYTITHAHEEFAVNGPYYIYPDSYAILGPQEDDVIIYNRKGEEEKQTVDYWNKYANRDNLVKVIERNGIPFIWPDVENDDWKLPIGSNGKPIIVRTEND